MNPAASPKSVKVEVYGSNGERLPIEPLYTLKPGETVDIRIDGQSSSSESCWARVEDVSRERSKPSLQASAREEQVNGNTLEDYPQITARPTSAGRWLTPAVAVRGRSMFFLNISDRSTVLKVCSTDASGQFCGSNGPGISQIAVDPRQSVAIKFRSLRKRYLLIESSIRVTAVVGILRPESPTSRVFSTKSSITFDDSARWSTALEAFHYPEVRVDPQVWRPDSKAP